MDIALVVKIDPSAMTKAQAASRLDDYIYKLRLVLEQVFGDSLLDVYVDDKYDD